MADALSFCSRSAAIFLAALLLLPQFVAGAAKNPDSGAAESVHGQPWAFGQSDSRNDAIWKKGVNAGQVVKNARPDLKTGAANTSGGINRSLSEAEKANVKSSLGLSMNDETSAWKVEPERIHPDENMYRDKRHVVRAFADVKTGSDLNISVGPELILKDEQHGDESASESQPDSALGLGMRFKYDF